MAAAPFVQTQRPKVVRGKAVLEADKIVFDPETQVARLSGNVVATYEQTKLTCAEAILDQGTGEARFTSGVVVTDPVGTLSASEVVLFFGETFKSGYAKGIVLDAYEAHFEGEELTFEKDAWRLKNAWFSTCEKHYKVLLTDIVIRPGRFIQAKRSGFELNGIGRVPIPFFRVGLNPRETGLQSPVPSMDENFQLGYRWDNVFTFGDKTTLSFDQRARLDQPPSNKAIVSFSLLDDKSTDPKILLPRNQNRERFAEAFNDNVTVRTQDQEAQEVGRDRLMLFVGASGNTTSSARPGTPLSLDRPVFAGVEFARQFGSILANIQISYGAVKERLTPGETKRLETYATALLRDIQLAKGLSLQFRADVATFRGDGTNYGWLRPTVCLTATPDRHVRLTASYFKATEWGTAMFDNDRLYSTNAAHLRADFDFASTDFSVLLKYDFDKRQLYDVEFALEQVADCIRPFVSYRKFPGTFAFGFTLRADKLFEALKKRVPTRLESPQSGGN